MMVKKTIIEDKQPFCEYEIGEICNLYKFWLKMPNSSQLINQDLMKDMIEYFYPNIKIEEGKFLIGISCVMWNKQEDIREKKEQEEGFKEAPIGQTTKKKITFFNLGSKNQWEKVLPEKILKKMNILFKEDLKTLAYE